MENSLYLSKGSEARFSVLTTDRHIRKALDQRFSGKPAFAQFHPLVKRRIWDGVVHHIDWQTATAPIGLFPKIYNFASAQSWDLTVDPDIWPHREAFTRQQVIDCFNSMDLPEHIVEVDQYQIEAVWSAVNNNKIIIVSPTGSGKSLIIYAILKLLAKKSLVIVPTVNLLLQMRNDFISYGCDPSLIADISAGSIKTPDELFVVSTWQSLYGRKGILDQYQVFVGDEAHETDTKSLLQISDDLVNASFRIGTTGSLPDDPVSLMTIIGIYGPVFKTTTTRELIDSGRATEPEITIHMMQHGQTLNRGKRWSYPEETKMLVSSAPRNQYIVDLAVQQTTEIGNTVVFVRYHEHIDILYQALVKLLGADRVMKVNKDVKRKDREAIRQRLESEDNLCVIATFKTFGTGTNARNLHSLIFAQSQQKRTKVIQAIGRGVRVHRSKSVFYVHDIADQLYKAKGTVNHGFTHAMARASYYTEEKLKWTVVERPLDYGGIKLLPPAVPLIDEDGDE